MPDKKLTYTKTYNPCDDCQHSFSKNNQESNVCKICEFKQSQETINRLQAENEKNENIIRLADKTIATANAEIERLKTERDKEHNYCNPYMIQCVNAKTSAYKEFAERLESIMYEKYQKYDDQPYPIATISIIDNLLKEMTGEQNA